jgi:acetylornithine deacetylase/succinyl-diaminopimelate desuccinylase-like protein
MDNMIADRVLNLAAEIQQIPAPTFAEGLRSEFIQQHLFNQGVTDVTRDEVGNVYAHVTGRGEVQPLVVSAHLDTVFPLNTDLQLSRTPDKFTGPGIGDNSLGLAGLFGLLWGLKEIGSGQSNSVPLPGDLWLVANVCEEGLGNLRGMKAIVDRFKQNSLAYLVLEGLSLGQVFHRGLGVRRYRITVHTPGGHSWMDHGRPSAVHELADLVVKFKNIPLPIKPRTSLNVGMISGGTSVNTIASGAEMLLDLRSEDSYILDVLAAQVEKLVEGANRAGGDTVKVKAEVIGHRPSGEITVEHPLVKLAVKCLKIQGITANLNIGSTDANEPLSRGLPAVCIGITTGGGAHTMGEYLETKPVGQGLAQLVDLVQGLFNSGTK